MKKMTTAILLFDLMAGMLFLGFYGLGSRAVATDSGIVQVEGEQRLEEVDVKKIAITFDDGPHRHPCHLFRHWGACGTASGYYRKNVQ